MSTTNKTIISVAHLTSLLIGTGSPREGHATCGGLVKGLATLDGVRKCSSKIGTLGIFKED